MGCDALNCKGITTNLPKHNIQHLSTVMMPFVEKTVTKSLRILISMWHFTGYMRIYSTGFDKVVNWRNGFLGATQTCAVGELLTGMAYS